jgi:hypothetical protein
MAPSSLRLFNVTVDKAVRTAETKILSEIPPPVTPAATALNFESFIDFNVLVDKKRIITEGEAISMGNTGVVIVDYTKPSNMLVTDPFTLLFGTGNNSANVDALKTIFKLNSETPLRLIRVIRNGVAALDKDTILGTQAVVDPSAIKYIYFQLHGSLDEYTQTPVFTTSSDWWFTVSLVSSIIDTETYERICFTVLQKEKD